MYNPPTAPPCAGYQMESFILILQLIITCVWSGNSGLKNLVNKNLVGKIENTILPNILKTIAFCIEVKLLHIKRKIEQMFILISQQVYLKTGVFPPLYVEF